MDSCPSIENPTFPSSRLVANSPGISLIIGSVSFFDGISTFVGYSMPKPSLYKNSNGTIYLIAGDMKGRIKRKGHRHEVNESIDSYQLAIDYMEIRPNR